MGFNVQRTIVYLPLKIDFILANSVDRDALWPYEIFHLSLHCLP